MVSVARLGLRKRSVAMVNSVVYLDKVRLLRHVVARDIDDVVQGNEVAKSSERCRRHCRAATAKA